MVISRANFIPIDWYGGPKKGPQKIKSKFFEIKLFPSKEKFHETSHVFLTDKPSTLNVERGFSVLTLLLRKL